MRARIVLHSLLIFFSCVCIVPPYGASAIASILLFSAGLFVAILIAGEAHISDTRRALVLSATMSGCLTIPIAYLCLEYPAIVVALSTLDIFFVLQAAFWPIALRPILVRRGQYSDAKFEYSVFMLSIIVAALSLFIAYPAVYGAVYVLFCAAMGHQLGRIRER